MIQIAQRMILIGAVLGFLSVALGAFGAHALKGVLSDYGQGIYSTAVDYQMFHALAILLLGLWAQVSPEGVHKYLFRAFLCFVFGTLFFCGSLYALSITEMKWLGAITPLGGVGFLVGWGLLIYTLITHKPQSA